MCTTPKGDGDGDGELDLVGQMPFLFRVCLLDLLLPPFQLPPDLKMPKMMMTIAVVMILVMMMISSSRSSSSHQT